MSFPPLVLHPISRKDGIRFPLKVIFTRILKDQGWLYMEAMGNTNERSSIAFANYTQCLCVKY